MTESDVSATGIFFLVLLALLRPASSTFCVASRRLVAEDSRWGDCGNGDIQLRSVDGGGSIVQELNAQLCVGKNSVAHLAGNLQQAAGAFVRIGQFSQLFLAPGRSLVLGPAAKILQDPDNYYSELNIHRSLTLGEKAVLHLTTYAYVYVNGDLSLGDGASVDLGFRASLYVYSCAGLACSVGPASSLVLETGAGMSNHAALTLRQASLLTLGPYAVVEAKGDVELEKAELSLGERAELRSGPASGLVLSFESRLSLADFASLQLGDGATLQLSNAASLDVGRRGSVSVEEEVFCIVRQPVVVEEQHSLVLDRHTRLEGVDCHLLARSGEASNTPRFV